MTFEQLITLEMIVEKGSFKAAAESLHKTQPSLSVAIKKLEEEFNVKLFNRDEYRPKLTDQGKTFYRWAQNSLRTFRELEVIGNELGTQAIEPSLEIILDPLIRFETVQPVFEARANLPSVTEFTFRSETMNRGMEQLLAGEADFAIALKAKEDERIESFPFENLRLVPVVAKKLLKNESVDVAWLRTHRQVVVSKDGPKKGQLEQDSLGMLGVGPKCFVTDHFVKKNLIVSGFGWGRLAEHEVKEELKKGTLIEIKHDSALPFTLKLHVMRCKLRPMGPVAKIIWEQLIKQAALCVTESSPKKRKTNPSS